MTERVDSVLSGISAGAQIRVLNLHDTPASSRAELSALLHRLGERFAPVSPADLDALSNGRRPFDSRPGLIVNLFNGLRSNAEVAAPILDEVGLVGWFYVPTAFLDAPAEHQLDFARERSIRVSPPVPRDGRIAMSWDELAALGEGHVIASHTRTHTPLGDGEENEVDEIVGSADDIELRCGRRPVSFAALGGARPTDRQRSLLAGAEYRWHLSNLVFERVDRERSSLPEPASTTRGVRPRSPATRHTSGHPRRPRQVDP